MALTNRAVIYSAQLLTVLRRRIVFAGPRVTNRDYQGLITDRGDRVRVLGIADPTVFDVTRNVDIPAPETLSDESAELVIDQEKGVNFQVDDLDRIQGQLPGQTILLQSALNAGQALATVADRVIAARMAGDVLAANRVGTQASPLLVNAPLPGQQFAAGQIDVYRVLSLLAVKLNKQFVPPEGRFAILPAFMSAALGSDPRFTLLNSGDVVVNGRVGRAAGFDLYESDAAPQVAGPAAGDPQSYQVVAGHPSATSYAEQLVHAEFYRPERRMHADAFKGSHVWGAKTFYPKALALATVGDRSGLDA